MHKQTWEVRLWLLRIVSEELLAVGQTVTPATMLTALQRLRDHSQWNPCNPFRMMCRDIIEKEILHLSLGQHLRR